MDVDSLLPGRAQVWKSWHYPGRDRPGRLTVYGGGRHCVVVPGDYVIVFGTTNNNHRRTAVGAVDGRGGGRCRLRRRLAVC